MTNFLRNSLLGVGLSLLALTEIEDVFAHNHPGHHGSDKPAHQCREIENIELFNAVPYVVGMGAINLGDFYLYKSNINKKILRDIFPLSKYFGFYVIEDELPFNYTEYWMNCEHADEEKRYPLVKWWRKSELGGNDVVLIINPYSGDIKAITDVKGFGEMNILPYNQPRCREKETPRGQLVFR